ncbi:hypothetical protein BDN72DRAFT_900688 [Pluteus cervinus]|uniref:Uncharacterized protein n=1 Tax=Pluteus cervinus TaxID=181527 RepID=A0ACD3AIG1_9AGAR|nr:hypothetical protein BDN72DRAFT_900688 [Pluteus cervinus]
MPACRPHGKSRSSPYTAPPARRLLRIATRDARVLQRGCHPHSSSILPSAQPEPPQNQLVPALFPNGDVPSDQEEALATLQAWIAETKATGGLSDATAGDFEECSRRLLIDLQDLLQADYQAKQVRNAILGTLECSICLETLQTPLIFCEKCLCNAFKASFESEAKAKLSGLLPDIASEVAVQQFPMTDARLFGTFLHIFVKWQGADFVREMRKYMCPICKRCVRSKPKVSNVLSRLSTTMQSTGPEERHPLLARLFVDLTPFEED